MINSTGWPTFVTALALFVQPVCGRIPFEAALGLVRFISESEPIEPIHPVSMDRNWDRDHARWSGRSMPLSDADHALTPIRRQFWLIGVVFTIGCAYSKSELQDRLARRVVPIEAGVGQSAGLPDPKTSDRATNDTTVRLAATSQPAQTTEARADNDRSGPLPPALEGPPRRPDSDAKPSPATSLPSDSDEATLDAIATSGKPLTLAEAIDLAFAFNHVYGPSSRASPRPRGRNRSRSRRFCRLLRAVTMRGDSASGWGANPFLCRKAYPDSTSCPASGPSPSASTSGRPSSWPSSRSNGCSWTSAVVWASTSRNDWRVTSPRSRPSGPTRRWPTKSPWRTTTSSGARPCGGRHRMPSVEPRKS